MFTFLDDTLQLRQKRDALNAQLDRLLDARAICPGYDAPIYEAELKRVFGEISQIDRVLKKAEVHIPCVVGNRPHQLAHH